MKKALILAAMTAFLFAMPTSGRAHDYDPDDSEHPLRYIAYVVHPVGVALQEWVFRPLHRLVSGPRSSFWFGHEPREEDHY